ncbi:MAG: hypothetical protein MPN21_16840 [Thermoanaerobaculia bacterium]|nr:hypothetical protein [Thermoanaerobaculia bacterium]
MPMTLLFPGPGSAIQRIAGRLAACFGLGLLIAVPVSIAQQGGHEDPGPIASQLPYLPVNDRQVELPLAGAPPFSWRAIAGGPATEHPDGHLRVRYTIALGRPAGAALIFRPGTLSGLDRLDIEIRGNRSTQLVPTLRDTSGVVYRFPAVPIQVGSPRVHSLRVAEMQYFPSQTVAPDPGSFDPGKAILLSLVDISAFTGSMAVGTAIDWSVSKLTAVLSKGQDKAKTSPTPARASTPEDEGAQSRAGQAETRFFEVFNGLGDRPLDRSAALNDLKIAFFSDPSDPRTALLLGLNYLWLTAEGDRTDLSTVDFLFLAERFLERAQQLNPDDRRIPSWLIPIRLELARIDRDSERTVELETELLAAYAEDPNFHSFSVGLIGFDSARGSRQFADGLRALRSARETCSDDDPTCNNRPRWAYNVEGFLTFLADYELKAGNLTAARGVLGEVQSRPGYATWPYRGEVEDRLANLALYADLYANADPSDDPPTPVINSRYSCQVCHRAR